MTLDSSPHDSAAALSGPLRLSIVPIPGAGEIALTHCPGRRQLDAQQRNWRRSLPDDLADIVAWNAVGIVCLVESHELPKLGVPDLAQQALERGLRWFHLEIPDMRPPGATFDEAWSAHGHSILDILSRGERIVMHCAAGLGRSGMVAAKLLVTFGMTPEQAIALVRQRRPGTIETEEQARYVTSGPALVR